MAKTQISLFLYQYISQPKMYVHAKGSNCSCTVQANLKVIRDIFRGTALPFPKGINS